MSTIGHPLSDLANFLTPFYIAHLHEAGTVVNARAGFLPGATPGLPTPPAVADLYATTAGWSSSSSSSSSSGGDGDWSGSTRARELQWAQAFNMFRQAAICQGIAARAAARQATSEVARRYADARNPLARFAWELVAGVMEGCGGGGLSAKL